MFIKVDQSSPVMPFCDQDELSVKEKFDLLRTCPQFDLRAINNKEEISLFLQSFFAYYFQLPQDVVTTKAHLIDDIEQYVWAKELEIPVDEVTYGRILCGKDKDGNATGGMSDRGLLMFNLFYFDFPDAVGLSLVEEKEQATFELGDDECKKFSDCNTIDELVEVLFYLKGKLF